MIRLITKKSKEEINKDNLFLSLLTITLIIVIINFFPKQRNTLPLITYFIIFILILGLFWHYRKIAHNHDNFLMKFTFRITYLIISIFLTALAIYMVASFVRKDFSGGISVESYLIAIFILLTAVFSFFLCADNLLRIFINKKTQYLIGGRFSSYHSLSLSLSSIILIGGGYYLNNPSNKLFTNVIIIIYTAFFISVVITNSLRELLRSN